MRIQPFELTDADIRFLLYGKLHLNALLAPTATFDDLQEQPLISALYIKNYTLALRLLNQRTTRLSPRDAAAACLCALAGPTAFMHTLLDHCPPISEFQFVGAGAKIPIVETAVMRHWSDTLELLLKRGADPNAGPTPETAALPMVTAFRCEDPRSLALLLQTESLRFEVTEHILDQLAEPMEDDLFSPVVPKPESECLKLLLEYLTGIPIAPGDPLPVPPQMRIEHALRHDNLALALRICQLRPMTEDDKLCVLNYYDRQSDHNILRERSALGIPLKANSTSPSLLFLLKFLEQFPDTLNHPTMRFAVAAATVDLSEPDSRLQHWADRLDDGPVFLKELSLIGHIPWPHRPYDPCAPNCDLDEEFFLNWEQRLGQRLIPTYSVSQDIHGCRLPDAHWRMLVSLAAFVGDRPADQLSPMAEAILRDAPVDLLADLMQPGKLLAEESPAALTNACLALPDIRRGRLLPFIHKKASYDL